MGNTENIFTVDNWLLFQNSFNLPITLLFIVSVFAFIVFISLSFAAYNLITYATTENSTMRSASDSNFKDNMTAYTDLSNCNCVVFRMDDIQDYWLNDIQVIIMDEFLRQNQSLSLGLIMNSVGNDSKIIEKLKEGIKEKLFELSLHGWNHIAYTTLSKSEQRESLLEANTKMSNLFGNRSVIFIPPLSVFNNDTLTSMVEQGITVISSDLPEETKFNERMSIFVAKHQKGVNDNVSSPRGQDQNVRHLPATVFFKDYENGNWLRIPNDEIISSSMKSIEQYGYSVIVLHPQDFALTSKNSSSLEINYINQVDPTALNDLSKLLEDLLEKKILITAFEKIVDRFEG